MYSASKYALHSVNDGLRRDLSHHGVRVLLVCPGIVDTGFPEHAISGTAPARVKEIRRTVSPDCVARSVLRAVEREARAVYVPWIGRIFVALDFLFPRVMDAYLGSKTR